MNSKKSIVLLITIFFISAISVLILQNLDDTNQYLDEVNSQNSISQTQITIQNIMEEIPKYLKKNKDDIEKILENTEEGIPLSIGNINIFLTIKEATIADFYINDLTKEDIKSDEFVNNISSEYEFLKIVNKYKENNNTYTNQKQINQIIKEYIKQTRDEDILKIKDKFTFIKKDKESTLIQCDCVLTINGEDIRISFIYDINAKDKVNPLKSFNLI